MRLADHDLGTPKGEGERVSLVINGQQVEAGRLHFARRASSGYSHSKLCSTDSLEAFGSCRMCLVKWTVEKIRCPLAPSPLARVWW